MFQHRVLVLTLVVSALAGLACAGLPSGEPRGVPENPPAALKVGASAIRKGQSEDPEKLAERARKKDEYSVKLAPGVRGLKLADGRVLTGNKRLDDSFGGLGLRNAEALHGRHRPKHAELAETLGLGRTITIRTARSPEEVIAKLEANPDVEWVEPVSEVQSADRPTKAGGPRRGGQGRADRGDGGVRASNAAAPNDPYWDYQWHMKNLDVPSAWQITQGEGVVVAVIDSGVSENEDGFFRLLKGYDFVDGDTDPADLNGHGTHVAGTIAQRSNNGIGVAGVAPKASILPVRVLDANGSGSNTWVASGILWAVDNGANIINLSLGSPMPSEVVADACAYAYENGVTVLAATGNDGFTDFVGYPAALPTTIAVGSVDLANEVAFYSNQGQQIDIVAPGGDTTVDANGDGLQDGVVQETIMNGTWSYFFLQGTSMATPHVAGVAALVYANGVTDPDDIRRVLTSSATDLGRPGWDATFGHGVVNPVGALGARPARGGGGDELIARHRVKKLSGSRASIDWITTEPAATFVKGSNGFKTMEDTPTKIHRVTVQGSPGEKVTFTFASRAGNKQQKEEVVVVF